MAYSLKAARGDVYKSVGIENYGKQGEKYLGLVSDKI